LKADEHIADHPAGIRIVAIEDTFTQDIAPFGIFLYGRGIYIANDMVSIDKNNFLIPAVEY
jgi:hypothetical protein